MKKIRVEDTSVFSSLPWWVARDEGLFEEQGIDVEFIPLGRSKWGANPAVTDWNTVSSNRGHASLQEENAADLYWGCEWGNYRRSRDSDVGGRQIGRRAAMACGAIIVPPWSDIYTPQQLANRLIGVPFHAGTHYLCLQMLEGFLPREAIKVCDANGRASERFHALMNHEVDACTVVEPWITYAEKIGCRIITQGFYNGTEVALDSVDADTYSAINRAISEAVRRINGDKRKYTSYYINAERDLHPELGILTPGDFNLTRLVFVEPTPIPEDQLKRTYEWMVSWNLIDEGQTVEDLVNTELQAASHSGVAVSDD
jgi:NitT/TauT family transport system substrate-binding protein